MVFLVLGIASYSLMGLAYLLNITLGRQVAGKGLTDVARLELPLVV